MEAGPGTLASMRKDPTYSSGKAGWSVRRPTDGPLNTVWGSQVSPAVADCSGYGGHEQGPNIWQPPAGGL